MCTAVMSYETWFCIVSEITASMRRATFINSASMAMAGHPPGRPAATVLTINTVLVRIHVRKGKPLPDSCFWEIG